MELGIQKEIKLVPTNPDTEDEALNTRLNALILSTEGTLPGNRNFGLQRNFLSRPPQQAMNLFAIELQEKVAEYMPEVSIKAVSGDLSGEGMDDLQVQIERSGKG